MWIFNIIHTEPDFSHSNRERGRERNQISNFLDPKSLSGLFVTSEGHATVQSGLENFGATSIIQSPRLTSDLPACLAYLYTQSMPSQLTVRVTDGVGGYCVLIKESNRQVDEFTEQKIDLPQANGRVNKLCRLLMIVFRDRKKNTHPH